MTASFEGPIPGDPFLMVGELDLDAAGYTGGEWFLSGRARSFREMGERTADGRWSAEPHDEADFKTRVVVRRPADASRFNGVVVVEWMNVSGGLDAAPDWFFTHRHLMRNGAAWVGVSVQKAGIDGGGLVPGMSLKQANAERYGGLLHPGDAFAFDLFSQVGRALRQPGKGPLGDLAPERILAVGESQSAGYLVTYVNAIDREAAVYDGFLIHGRPGAGAPLDGGYLRAREEGADLSDLSDVPEAMKQGHRIREDLRVPVIILQSETDVVTLGSVHSRQPDGEKLRLWEIAGAAHFDTYGLMASQIDQEGVSVEDLAERMAPTDNPMGLFAADSLVNSGPQQHYVLNAAIEHLARWAGGGAPAPEAPRLELHPDDPEKLHRDERGIVRGGIRSPWVDAPTAALSGDAPGGEGFLFLFGKTRPFSTDELETLYPGGPGEHQKRFEAAAREAAEAGFLLEADLAEITALSRHGRQPSGFN